MKEARASLTLETQLEKGRGLLDLREVKSYEIDGILSATIECSHNLSIVTNVELIG